MDPKDDTLFSGYLDAPNWWSLALLLPATLFALRWLAHKSSPVSSRWPPKHEPPIIGLITEPRSKPVVYAALRRSILARSNLLAVLALVTLVTILDMFPVVMPYIGNAAPEQIQNDWVSMYRISPDDNGSDFHVSKAENIALLVSAYMAQVAITFIGIMAIVVLLRHNLFFSITCTSDAVPSLSLRVSFFRLMSKMLIAALAFVVPMMRSTPRSWHSCWAAWRCYSAAMPTPRVTKVSGLQFRGHPKCPSSVFPQMGSG